MVGCSEKKVVKAEEFWSTADALVTSFERGEDVVAKMLVAVNPPVEEAVVEC